MNATMHVLLMQVVAALLTIVALYLAGASLCRCNAQNPKTHKFSWRIRYVFYGGLALSSLGYAWFEPVDLQMLLLLLGGLLAPALKVAATQKDWRAGQVPASACKQPTQEARATDWDAPFIP